ncbi:MAG: hypothetical protein RSE55_04390 [Lachnospiraceae bacterium]
MKKIIHKKIVKKLGAVFLLASAILLIQPFFSRATPNFSEFPESYRPYLQQLSQAHPSWKFIPQETGLDWKDVVQAEKVPKRNLIGLSNPITWKSLNSGDYNTATGTWDGKSGKNWVQASESLIKYSLDPRNCLTESNIFIFEQLRYNEENQVVQGVDTMLRGTFMSDTCIIDDDGNSVTYAQAFMQIGRLVGISPYHIASYARFEQGALGTSPLISGTYKGYEGYYNYFNIKASGKTETAIYTNGLKYAKAQGWTTPYKALLGGAKFVFDSYIGRGQDTLYLQKFDVDNSDGTLYTHQYMQDVMGAYNKSTMQKKTYDSIEATNNTFVFKIPVYTNMPENAYAKPGNTLEQPEVIAPYVSAEYDSVLLNWDEISGATGYAIYRGKSPEGTYTKVQQVNGLTTTTWTDTGIEPNQVYYYKIRATVNYTDPTSFVPRSIMSADTQAKKISTQINATTLENVEKTGATAATITWKKASNVTGYKVYRSTSATTGFNEIKKITSDNILSYTEEGLIPNRIYYYKVKTYKMIGTKNYESEASSLGEADLAVSRSEIASVSNKNDGSVEIMWEQQDGVTGYKVYRADQEDGVFNCIGTLVGKEMTSCKDQLAVPNRTYFYKIRSYVVNNRTKYYADLSASKKINTRVKAVTSIMSEPEKFTTVELTWEQLTSRATGVKVYRSKTPVSGYKLVATIKGASTQTFSDAKVLPNDRYYYKVRNYLRVGEKNYYSYYSDPLEVHTDITKPIIQSVNWDYASAAELSYKTIEGVTGYRILRAEEGGKYVWVKTVKSQEIDTWMDKKVVPNTTYKYLIKAYVRIGKDTYFSKSSKAFLMDTAVKTTTILSSKHKTPTSIVLKWEPMEGMSGYKIYRASSLNGTYTLMKTIDDPQKTMYTNTTCKEGRTYYYKIRTILTIGDITYTSADTEPVVVEP